MYCMNLLALDIGMRRTGIAFCSGETDVPVALDTFAHTDTAALVEHVLALVRKRELDRIVCGFPLLLSGDEGSQCAFVKSVVDQLEASGIAVSLLDERYSTPNISGIDGDAAAACQLLLTFLEREKRSR